MFLCARVHVWQNHLQPNCAKACWFSWCFDGGTLVLHRTVRVLINLNVTKTKQCLLSKALIYNMPLIKMWLILIKGLLNQVIYHPQTLIIFHWFFFSTCLPRGYFALFADKVKQTLQQLLPLAPPAGLETLLRYFAGLNGKKTFEAGHSWLKLPDSGLLTARQWYASWLLRSTLANVSEKPPQWISR